MVEVPQLDLPLRAAEQLQHRGQQQGAAQCAARRARAARSRPGTGMRLIRRRSGTATRSPSRSIQVRSPSFSSRPSCAWTQILRTGLPSRRSASTTCMLAIAPFLAPLAQRQHDRQQALALGRQRIDDPPLVRRVGRALEDPAGDQLGKPVRQDVAGDPQARLEFLEMLEAVEGAAKDQERPFFADQLDRRRESGTTSAASLNAIDVRRAAYLPACAAHSPVESHQSTRRRKNSCNLKLRLVFSCKSQL